MGELLDASNSASTMTTPPNDFAMLVKDLTTGQLKKVTTKDCIQIFPNKVYDSFIPTTCEFDKKASYAVVKKNKVGIKQVLKIRILAMRETMSEINEIEGTIKNPVLAKQEIMPFSTFKHAAEVKAIKARKEEQKIRKRGCSSDLSKEFLKKKKKTSEMESNNLETPKLGTITCKQPNGKPASKGKPDDVKETPQDLEEQIPTTSDPTGEILMNSPPDSVHSSTVLLPAHTEETSNFNTPRKQHGMSNSTKDSDISPTESVIDETNNKKTEKPEEPNLSNLEKNSMNSKGNKSKETPENQTKEDEKSPTASICKRLDDIEESLQCLLSNQNYLKKMLDEILEKIQSPSELQGHPLWKMPRNAVCPQLSVPVAPPANDETSEEEYVYIGCRTSFLPVKVIQAIVYLTNEKLQERVQLLTAAMVGRSNIKNYCLRMKKEDEEVQKTMFPDDFILSIKNLINHGIVKTSAPGSEIILFSESDIRDKLRKVLHKSRVQ